MLRAMYCRQETTSSLPTLNIWQHLSVHVTVRLSCCWRYDKLSSIGVRGGGMAAAAHRLEKMRASSSCSKFLNDKKYFNTVKIFRATLCLSSRASCSNILNDKNIYVKYSENFQGKLCFSGQGQVAQKSWMIKIYVKYSEKFHDKLCFSVQAQVVHKSSMIKYISIQWKFSG